MEIELQRIGYNPRVSTDSFAANLVINGVKAATINKKGAETMYYPVNAEGEKLTAKAEEFLKKQADPTTLADRIDKLFSNYLAGLESKKFDKKVALMMKRNIVIGEPNKYMRMVQTGTPVEMLLKGAGRQMLVSLLAGRVIPTMSENERILNTNIPDDILKESGLSGGQLLGKAERTVSKEEKEPVKKARRPGVKI